MFDEADVPVIFPSFLSLDLISVLTTPSHPNRAHFDRHEPRLPRSQTQTRIRGARGDRLVRYRFARTLLLLPSTKIPHLRFFLRLLTTHGSIVERLFDGGARIARFKLECSPS